MVVLTHTVMQMKHFNLVKLNLQLFLIRFAQTLFLSNMILTSYKYSSWPCIGLWIEKLISSQEFLPISHNIETQNAKKYKSTRDHEN